LFVIMLLGAEKLPVAEKLSWQRPLAIGLAVVLLLEGGYMIVTYGLGQPVLPAPPANYATPSDIGMALFNDYLLPFEITSVILLVAVVGAIVLTRAEKKEKK
jgi:NADH-quinone oxidoreductase subunit J